MNKQKILKYIKENKERLIISIFLFTIVLLYVNTEKEFINKTLSYILLAVDWLLLILLTFLSLLNNNE
jgi:hypothetical protein